jgi:RNA polymerase sigma factor (sigma-70 family)
VPQPPFDVLVERHGATVLRVCRALVGVQDADDVWQETFLAAMRAYPQAGGVLNLEAWLVTIAKNKATDHHRKTLRVPLPAGGMASDQPGAGELHPGAQDAGGGDVVVRAVQAGEVADVVWAALATLPPTQRAAVIYHHLAGLPYVQVAELVGNSEAAARRAAADGMKALRARLSRSEP